MAYVLSKPVSIAVLITVEELKSTFSTLHTSAPVDYGVGNWWLTEVNWETRREVYSIVHKRHMKSAGIENGSASWETYVWSVLIFHA